MDLTAAVDVAAARQVPLGHGESWSAVGGEGNKRGTTRCLSRVCSQIGSKTSSKKPAENVMLIKEMQEKRVK